MIVQRAAPMLLAVLCTLGPIGAGAATPPATTPQITIPPATIPPAATRQGATPTAAFPALTGSRKPGPHRLHVKRPWIAAQPVITANRQATLEPTAQGFINAVQVFPFADGVIYHVITAPGQVTDIALQPGEGLVSVASGDTVRWVIGDTTSGAGSDKRTHVLVKPYSAGLVTNLVITTDRRSYHIALSSTASTALSALSWTYPQDAMIALKHAEVVSEAAAPVAAGIAVEQLHFNYVLTGDHPAWRPTRAFDDGRQTFIEFPATLAVGEAPPIFIVGRKGEAQLVNYRVKGHFYVVDRIFDAAELRLGTKDQQVVRINRVGEAVKTGRGA